VSNERESFDLLDVTAISCRKAGREPLDHLEDRKDGARMDDREVAARRAL
jgi:hypothetical protein